LAAGHERSSTVGREPGPRYEFSVSLERCSDKSRGPLRLSRHPHAREVGVLADVRAEPLDLGCCAIQDRAFVDDEARGALLRKLLGAEVDLLAFLLVDRHFALSEQLLVFGVLP